MTTPWKPVYTDEQRDAVETATLDRGLSGAEVARRARAGDLRPGLAPFDIPDNTVRDMKRKAKRRRGGHEKTGLTDVPHADAIDALRKRLISAADNELTWVEQLQKTARKTSTTGDTNEANAAAGRRAERLRQVARAVREAAAIVVPNDNAKPVRTGQRDPATGKTNGSPAARAEGTLAGAIVAAHNRTSPLADTPQPETHPTQSDNGRAATPGLPGHEPTTTTQDPTRGGDAGARIASELARAVLGGAPGSGGSVGVEESTDR